VGKGQGKHRNHSAAVSEGLLGQSSSLIIPQASSSGGFTRDNSNAILEATASIDNPLLVMDLSKIVKSQKKKGGSKTKLKPMQSADDIRLDSTSKTLTALEDVTIESPEK
jgi:hypothetical protein